MSDQPRQSTLRTEIEEGVCSIVLTRAAEYDTITPTLRDARTGEALPAHRRRDHSASGSGTLDQKTAASKWLSHYFHPSVTHIPPDIANVGEHTQVARCYGNPVPEKVELLEFRSWQPARQSH